MSEKDGESQSIGNNRTNWSRFFDSATLIAVLSGVAYYLGSRYYKGYFETFGLNDESIELPTSEYVIAAVTTLYLSLAILIPGIDDRFYRPAKPTTSRIAF